MHIFNNPRMRCLLVFSIAAFLGACATAPTGDPQALWQARQQRLAPIDGWELQGRVSIRTADKGGQATIRWSRDKDTHRIDLTFPLGAGSLRLTQDPHEAQLRDNEGRVHRGRSLRQLLRHRIGWELPLDELNDWVLGLPAATPVEQMELDEYGRLSHLRQQGWTIEFPYYSDFSGHELPERVFVKRLGDEAVEVRLVVTRWDVRPSADP